MADAFAAVNPWSITLRSAIGRNSIAAAATSRATSAMAIRPRYGAMKGISEARGRRDLPFGRSELVTEPEFAQVQLPPHAEIAREAVERMAERGGLVALEAEVPEPREAVARQQPGR